MATTTKNRGGRPKGSKPRDVAAVAKLVQEVHAGLTKGVIAYGPDGLPVLGPDGKPLRRQPSAAWMNMATRVLTELGSFKKAAADPKIAESGRKGVIGPIADRLRELREAGKIPGHGKLPPLSEEADPGEWRDE